jgi:hypothetical protein
MRHGYHLEVTEILEAQQSFAGNGIFENYLATFLVPMVVDCNTASGSHHRQRAHFELH